MNLTETAKVLTIIQSFDGRTVEAEDVRAWQMILAHEDYNDAAQAVVNHFTVAETGYVRPATIRRLARAIRDDRHRVAAIAPPPPSGMGVREGIEYGKAYDRGVSRGLTSAEAAAAATMRALGRQHGREQIQGQP